MGLDSYLNRMPHYKDTSAEDIVAIESYLCLRKYQESGDELDTSLYDWCGRSEDELPNNDVIYHYKQIYDERNSLCDEVGYWRKANAIHNWFVEHVQDGIDDCRYHNEVTKELLEELLDTCIKVYESCTMIIGQVNNGESYINGEWVPNVEVGKTVIDSSLAEELLPTCSGFFFGSTDYNEWYVENIRNTIEIINEVLETTDFDTEMIAYCSSW